MTCDGLASCPGGVEILLAASILGDPGAVSGGGRKSKRARKKFGRRKVKNE